jgi:hypothetical protein
MRGLSRLLIVCLLLLAIPFKGAVAASMVMCGPEHDRMTTMGASNAGSHETASAVAHADHDHAAHQHMHSADEKSANAQDSQADPQGTVKCSICAACCVGGAFLLAADSPIPAPAGSASLFATLTIRYPGVVLAGLERPPRTFLV